MKPTDFKTALMKCWDDLIQKDKTNQARILKQSFEKVEKQKNTQKLTIRNLRAFCQKIKAENEELKNEKQKLQQKIDELESQLEWYGQ